MKRTSPLLLLALVAVTGCSSGPKAPSTADAAAAQAQAKQTLQKNIDVIQNNPHMSPEQKAQIIAHLNQPQPKL
jgi:hypothetical protein